MGAVRRRVKVVSTKMDHAGVYLTDEVFLFRVVDLQLTGAGAAAELEDCYGLDVVRVPLNDLRARRLRVVTPTPHGAEPGL
jgi:hypothetical protein